jgi:hypothetical protein
MVGAVGMVGAAGMVGAVVVAAFGATAFVSAVSTGRIRRFSGFPRDSFVA